MKQKEFFEVEVNKAQKDVPLALRMSPATLDELVGQEHILSKGKLLRRAIDSDRLGSIILYGPPGTGKSALARIIARETEAFFEETNAVTVGVNDIRQIIKQAKLRLEVNGKKTILLLDEIHHFNKTQQDALLPDVEKGIITLVGITTENPFFYVNSALISRSTQFEFRKLDENSLSAIIDRVLSDKTKGLAGYNVELTKEARKHLLTQCNGDARQLLNAVEIGVLTTKPDKSGKVLFDIDVAQESLQKKLILYDKSGDEHYDHASAFIKSMRGSDPDAALYWMAKMLSAGEDPRFIARRIIICSSEDVGNASPNALILATSALNAVEFVGMPEARIILAQAVAYVASAPKSNASYLAIDKAMGLVKEAKLFEVPNHLKDATMDGKARGHGAGYKYPHDFPGHFIDQEYWPGKEKLYEPGEEGYEKEIKKRLEFWRAKAKDQTADAQKKRQAQ
jgi:putative ATPase